MKPPIPPPDGGMLGATLTPAHNLQIPDEAVRVFYQGTNGWKALTRFTFKQFFNVPFCWLAGPLLWPALPLLLPFTVLGNYALLKWRGLSTTALSRNGVWDVGNVWSYCIPWNRVMFVFDWGGDVAIVTFGGGSLMPREAFTSREEAAEFAAIARQLHKSRGAAWRDEWNGKVFGHKV